MSTPLGPEIPSRDTFGPAMKNYDAIVDPETDLDATHWNRITAQLAAVSQTAPKAVVTITIAAGIATVVQHRAQWGNDASVAPVVTRTSAGALTVVWPTLVNDLQAAPESHAVSIVGFVVSPTHGTQPMRYLYYHTNARAGSFNFLDNAGTATDPTEVTILAY